MFTFTRDHAQLKETLATETTILGEIAAGRTHLKLFLCLGGCIEGEYKQFTTENYRDERGVLRIAVILYVIPMEDPEHPCPVDVASVTGLESS